MIAGEQSQTVFVPQVDERLLCYHGPLVYEAKCLEKGIVQTEEGGVPKFKVHYKGWSKSWDEWVTSERILPYNEETLKLQKELKARFNERRKRKNKGAGSGAGAGAGAGAGIGAQGGKSSNKGSGTTGTEAGGRGGETDAGFSSDGLMSRIEVKLSLPEALQLQLVDDWDFIVKQKKLVSLPRKPCIDTLLDAFLKERKKKLVEALEEVEKNDEKKSKGKARQRQKAANIEMDLVKEVVSGVKTYFDFTLGHLLLYRFERQQYADVVEAKKSNMKTQVAYTPSLCDVYGAEHLLRLFVKLPGMLIEANIPEDHMCHLTTHISEIIAFVNKHREKYFIPEYEAASPEYVRLSDC
eukprot:Nk52_evm10s967 gene=Nk52_evmTU10s967